MIAPVFPALFNADQFCQMDARELQFWERNAVVEQLKESVRQAAAARYANATNESFNQMRQSIENEISIIEGRTTREEIWTQNWDDLIEFGG